MKVRILPSAKRDLQRSMRFYENQQTGLGNIFLSHIIKNIEGIESLGGIHPLRNEHHRFIARRFPFWIYYRIDGPVAYVVAILDARQNPKRIQLREKMEMARLVGLRRVEKD